MSTQISVVTTTYNNSQNLEEFIKRISSTLSSLNYKFEIIVVDDGSDYSDCDKSKRITDSKNDVRFIELTRNFGHHKALMAGMNEALGDVICLIDSDLEESPEDLEVLLKKYYNEKVDVVYGFQKNRAGNYYEKISGWLFYKLMKSMDVPIPKNFMTMRVMSRRFTNSFLSHQEYVVNLSSLLTDTGYKQIGVPLRKIKRRKGNYTFKRKMQIVSNSITSHSVKPLLLIFQFGLIVSAISILVSIFIVARWFITKHEVSGWTSLIVSIWTLGGFIIFSLGLIGVYVSNIYLETKKRPRWIIKGKHE